MDPIEQILAQGRTQESSFNGADYYFKGVQANQQQQQINLSRQRLMLEQQQQQNANVLAPLQAEALRLNNDVLVSKSLTQHAEAVASVETLKGNLDMAQMVARRLAEGTLTQPDAMTEYNAIVQKNPYAALGQPAMQFSQQFQIGMKTRQLNAQFGKPESVSVIDKETGTTTKYGEPDTIQMKNAAALAKFDSVLNDPNASEAEIAAAQTQKDALQQQLRDSRPKTVQLQDARDSAIARGDFDSAHELDNQIAAEAQKAAGRGFAPSAMGKKIQEWQQALLDGNPLVIKYYERELGMAGLDATQKAQYRAGLAAINADPTMFKAEDKQKAQEAFTVDFMAKHTGTSGASTPPATSSSDEVTRLTSDGKKAVFDSKTKKFLRYAQ